MDRSSTARPVDPPEVGTTIGDAISHDAVVNDDLGIALLGPLRVRLGERDLEVRSGRLQAVLAVLAMEAGRPVSTEQIARAVWGEDLPVNVRKSVQTNIVRLRRLLGGSRIRTEPGGYLLDVEPDQVDAVRFGSLLSAAALESDPSGERRLLTEALALWRGTPFESVGSPWLDEVESERMIELYLSARERWFDLDLAAGRYDAAVAELREITARFPLREALWSRLLTALRLSGRHAEALACYEAVRVLLANELGVDPGPELRRQYSELLDNESPAPRAQHAERPSSESPQGGATRQPQDPEPTGRTQYAEPTRPTQYAERSSGEPARQSTAVPQQLPAARGVFVGRTRELKMMDDLFACASNDRAPESEMIVFTGSVASARPRWRSIGRIVCATGSPTASCSSTSKATDRANRSTLHRRSTACSSESASRSTKSPTTSRPAAPCSGQCWPADAACSYSTTPSTRTTSAR